ncbi:hypothetical protein [Mesoterricola silvestris]|uniref:Uncharacterized protein n=1 Tax=Mesoterricola silvestris TaxID=2927979 RepID=A0AA48GMS7_9BACT|nr:hypothetical protein [Mesoterricola silvestris]BDU72385.1 hypothetical protein METEAL_15590 [Mesoterricola silvestris]
MGITHAAVVAVADDGTSPVGSDEWNAAHSVDTITGIQDAQTPLTLTRFFQNFVASYAGYIQANFQNKDTGSSSSTDVVCTTDSGTDTAEYIDLGINGSGYAGAWGSAKDGYLYVDGGASGIGDLIIGTAQANTTITLQAGASGAIANGFFASTTYQAAYNKGLEERLGGVIWTKTSATTLASFTTAATLIGAVGTGVGTLTLPANFLTVGRTIRIRMKGVYGDTTTAPTLNFTITLGGVTVVTSTAITMTTASMTNRPWELDVDIVCRATGTTATVIGSGFVRGANTAAVMALWPLVATAAVNVDTTASAVLGVTVACGTSNAANTITCHTATVEVIG